MFLSKSWARKELTHWGRMTHICVSNLTIIGSDNGLSPGRRQAITWTNVGILLIGPLGTNFSEMLIEIHTFSFKKIHLKMSSGKWQPFCLGLNVLSRWAWWRLQVILCGHLGYSHHILCPANSLFGIFRSFSAFQVWHLWSSLWVRLWEEGFAVQHAGGLHAAGHQHRGHHEGQVST